MDSFLSKWLTARNGNSSCELPEVVQSTSGWKKWYKIKLNFLTVFNFIKIIELFIELNLVEEVLKSVLPFWKLWFHQKSPYFKKKTAIKIDLSFIYFEMKILLMNMIKI